MVGRSLRYSNKLIVVRAPDTSPFALGAPRLDAVEELEDHLDDLLDRGELEARVGNTVGAAKLVVPAAWKASQDECASFLGKL